MRLTSLALLAPVSHGWISISQSKYGATIEHIHTESLGQDAGDPRRSLGYLWTLPDDAEDNTGLGGSVTWAWDGELCDALLPRVRENFWFIPFVTCETLRASAHRGFATWEQNSRFIKFTDVSQRCVSAGYPRADECPFAEIAVAPARLPANASIGAIAQEGAVNSTTRLAYRADFLFTSGQRSYKTFGVPGTPYYYKVDRQVPTVIGGTISLRTEGACWYVDSQFCGPLHIWKRQWRNPMAAYGISVTILFGLWSWLMFKVCYAFGMAVKRVSHMHQKLLLIDDGDKPDGDDDEQEDQEQLPTSTRARLEALSAVVARRNFWNITLRLMLIIMPWPYFLAIFHTCWHCYDLEAAIAHEMGHVLGLGSPDLAGLETAAGFEPNGTNSYHVHGAALRMNHSTCVSDLWADVLPGVPPGALDLDPITNVRPSIMQSFDAHSPLACLQPDDLEALNVLYPQCNGAPTTPVCEKPPLNIGWPRLIIMGFVPIFVIMFFVRLLRYYSIKVARRNGGKVIMSALKAEALALHEEKEARERLAAEKAAAPPDPYAKYPGITLLRTAKAIFAYLLPPEPSEQYEVRPPPAYPRDPQATRRIAGGDSPTSVPQLAYAQPPAEPQSIAKMLGFPPSKRPEGTIQMNVPAIAFVGAVGLDTVEFEYPADATSTLHDIAAAVHHMNEHRMGLGQPPTRLWIQGHVSNAKNGKRHAKRLSAVRAQFCGNIIREEMMRLNSRLLFEETVLVVVTEGMGAEHPLPGLEDPEGNFAENRRVEFHLEKPEQSAYQKQQTQSKEAWQKWFKE